MNKELLAFLLKARWHFQHNRLVRSKAKLRKAVFEHYWLTNEYKKYKTEDFNSHWDYLDSEGLIKTKGVK